MTTFFQRLRLLFDQHGPKPFRGRRIGLEKESLRIGIDGCIAHTPHPQALGSALTNGFITTDFSEALLEFITPPDTDAEAAIRFLGDLHRYCYTHLNGERLWVASMPCKLLPGDSIPIAHYGSSNIGRMKAIYRRGLSHRYGRAMQIIAGVHFNFSLPESLWQTLREAEQPNSEAMSFQSQGYFALVRNFQRIGWIVPYLFGCSPMVCDSFLQARGIAVSPSQSGVHYSPYATSLRVSDIGYKSNAQRQLRINYNSVDDYVRTLSQATETRFAEFATIGEFHHGQRQQLNVNQLQIENEYYSLVRPKQIAKSGEKPTRALYQRGVRYVEIRALDLDPYAPVGISADTLHFMEILLIGCALHHSPPITDQEQRQINDNQCLIAVKGRKPKLILIRRGKAVTVTTWAKRILHELEPLCAILDAETDSTRYTDVHSRQWTAITDPSLLPSSRIMADIKTQNQSFYAFAQRQSERHRDYFLAQPLAAGRHLDLETEALESLQRQTAIERADTIDFETYLANYLAQPVTG